MSGRLRLARARSVYRAELTGFLGDLYWRPYFEGARPTVPPPLMHKFVDQDAGSDTGTGTETNPLRNPYPATLYAKPGEYWHLRGRGRPDDASILPLADGTPTDWITFGDWDGAPLELPGPTGPQPVVTLDGRKHICVERLTIDATNSSTMDCGAIRGNGVGCASIVVRHCKVQVRAGQSGIVFFIDPTDIWIEDCDLDGHGRDDVRQANAGDGLAFGGNQVARRCVAYRNRIADFGHMGIQALTQDPSRHNSQIAAGFNRVGSTLAGGIAYLRTDESLVVGNVLDGIATNPASASNSKEAIIVNGRRNRYFYQRIHDCHGPAVLLLMSSFGGVGQSCSDNDLAGNAIYGGQTYPLAITLRTNVPDLDGVLEMRGNQYRNNLHGANMRNASGGYWIDRIWQAWVTIGAAGFHIPDAELARWCPGGVANTAGRQLAGVSIRRNVWDPVVAGLPPAGFLMYNASDASAANVNTTYLEPADAERAFGADAVTGNVVGDAGFAVTDPTAPDFLTIRADALGVDIGEIVNAQPFAGAGTDVGAFEVAAGGGTVVKTTTVQLGGYTLTLIFGVRLEASA
jgi:hypothetical protein